MHDRDPTFSRSAGRLSRTPRTNVLLSGLKQIPFGNFVRKTNFFRLDGSLVFTRHTACCATVDSQNANELESGENAQAFQHVWRRSAARRTARLLPVCASRSQIDLSAST